MNHMWKHRLHTGNTTVEYGVIGLLVVAASIGGLQLAGGNLSGWMGFLKKDMDDTTRRAGEIQLQQQQAAAAEAAAQAALNNNSSNGGNDAGSTSPIAVSGSNGTTASYANDILAQARAALDNGSINQSEYDLVVRLANKGHDIAFIQGLMENAYKQSQGNSSAYANTMLTFNGQNYTLAQLNAVLQSNISDFSVLRQQASTLQGVLYNTALLSSINTSGGQIINAGYATQQQNQSAASFIQYQNEGLGVKSGSTHQNSATICNNNDNSRDSGVHCSQ